jgi:hypothetical protein
VQRRKLLINVFAGCMRPQHAAWYGTARFQAALTWVVSVHVQALHDVCQAKAWQPARKLH